MFKESEDIYNRCIALIPDSFALYFNLGMLYNQTGEYGEAAGMFEQVLRLKPGYQPAEVLLKAAGGKLSKGVSRGCRPNE